MKIGILSMQKINNMGSVLQAYALKHILENMDNDVEFIDIKRINEDYAILGEYKKEYNNESENKNKIKKIDKYILNRIKIKGLSLKQHQEFDYFREEELNINKKSNFYDLCIIGSDEVFNCLGAGDWGFTSQLFGNVSEAKKVITYAASCGFTRYDELPKDVAKKIAQAFERVYAFSVRDNNTHEFVSNLTEKKIIDNLDPVLIYDYTHELEKVSLPKLPKKYCVVYSYYNRIHDINEIRAIKRFCKSHKMVPIAVGAPQFWIKDYIVCSPFQCLKIFNNAEFVITDTFHGTIFSAKYANKFATLIRQSNKNKLSDLVQRIGMQNHLLSNMNDLERVYNCEKDTDKFESIINKEREKTLTYLNESLS